MIFDGIRRYISESTQTRGRTYHVTMTYFWVQLVHLGIRNMPPIPSSVTSESVDSTAALAAEKSTDSLTTIPSSVTSGLMDSTATLIDEKSTVDSPTPSPDHFARFLLLNPHVVDGNIWSDYYSKQTMMSLEAKAHMVLPDKKPLPNLVVRDAILSTTRS